MLVQIMANGQPTGILVDADELQAAHDAWYANPANTKCSRCSFAAPQHAPSCPNAGQRP
jgi:hypothetical protein